MKPKRSLKIVYLYVVENKDKFGYKYEMILSNLKKIKELPTPVNFEKEEFDKSFQQVYDNNESCSLPQCTFFVRHF